MPECHARREKISKLEDGEEFEVEKKPESALVGERIYVGTAEISMRPMDWAVMRWEACEDIHAGDSLVNVFVKDARHKNNMTIRKACRPFKDPETDILHLFGIALEDTPRGEIVPVHLLAYVRNKDTADNYIELKDAVLYKEVENDPEQ